MSPGQNERRPLAETAIEKVQAKTKADVTAVSGRSLLATLDDLAQVVDGTFVVVVEHPGARFRRRCFLTAASAQRSARSAQERGLNAVVYMAELKPLWRVIGGDT